jgi:hypothetical protein
MASFSIGHHLWLSWLQIASDHTRAAEHERARSLQLAQAGEDPGPARTREMQNAMVAISASAHAIDGLYGEIKLLIPVPDALVQTWEESDTPRSGRLSETFKIGCRLGDRTNRWPRQLKALYKHRDRLVHHVLELKPAVAHPGDPLIRVGQDMADYTLDTARESVDLAYDVALAVLQRAKAPELIRWAQGMDHTIRLLEALRATSRGE